MVQETLDYTGRIEPSQRVEVRSRLSGYLQAIKFRDGQQVKAGDPLFVIDQRPFAIARDRAQANFAQAIVRQKLALKQLARITHLQQSGASSSDELDRIRSEFEGAQAAVLLSQAELRSADLELSFATIKSPISGTVSDHRVDIGNYVVGGTAQGGLLTTIVAQSPLRATVDLSEYDFARLRQQKQLPERIQIRLDGVTGTQVGTIDFIDNEISARSGTLRLRTSIANVDKTIKPGSFAHVRIPVGAPEEKLLVPDSAIQSDQTKKLVLVVDANGKVAPKRVELGGLYNGKRVVLSGLSADDKIIVSGAQRVRPGDSVKLSTPVTGA
ncbi:efflux RND transporter periplasmic adaptor subunit [Undibacterium piscinae]|uniref:Efflux RND transporter periplasmic adaptor subunit n=2 Tax=Undibacterium TaxID=401469 RepID=A0A6M4A5X5_9BURK|nr:efflux RND transporter periplasmic adaptor subunit [Undibacterium piscinae]